MSSFFDSIMRDSFSFFDRMKRDSQAEQETKEAYKEASGVDIEEQRRIWDERAKGYWGEYKVFSAIFRELDFPNKILVNTQIPAENGRKTEVDLLLFAPTGIYVFEIKHYSGKVYGGYDKPTWTEYYKTRDSVTFENPLKQNEYHLSQLRRLLPNAQFYSYVVFTNSNAEIKVGGRYPGHLTVCQLDDLTEKIRGDFAGRVEIYSAEQIEKFFSVLSPFSPLEINKDQYFEKDDEILPFSGYAEAILQELKEEKRKAKDSALREVQKQLEELNKEREEVQRQKEECQVSIRAAENERDNAIKSLEEFAKNFETVKPYSGGAGAINRDSLKAEVRFSVSDSFLHATNMYFTLSNSSSELWIETIDSWFIIGLKNGSVHKYVLREHVNDYHIGSKIEPKGVRYGSPIMMRLYNMSVDDISYIKLCNTVVTDRPHSKQNVAPGIEFEIYTADGVDSVFDSGETKAIANLNGSVFELNPDFLKCDICVDESTDGTGSDIKFSFSACTEDVGSIEEYAFKKCASNFYSSTVMPRSKTNTFIMHLSGVRVDEIVFVKLKGARIFRKENWTQEDLLPGVEIEVYPQNDDV